jgi:acetoacetate decarboxylase
MTTDEPSTLRIPSPREAAGTPIDSPLSGLPPARFSDGEVLTFQYVTDPSAIRALLPLPLEPINDVVQYRCRGGATFPVPAATFTNAT